MPVLPFKSDAEVAEFAREFLGEYVERFSKDIAICLRPDENRSHAYFPALITCIAFAELLSGLHAGNLESGGLKKLKDYASDFMDQTLYDADRLEILYEMFRHKVAHLAQPYAVFTKPALQGQPRRITWTVEESGPKPAIEIVPETSQILRAVTPCVLKRTFDIEVLKGMDHETRFLRIMFQRRHVFEQAGGRHTYRAGYDVAA